MLADLVTYWLRFTALDLLLIIRSYLFIYLFFIYLSAGQ